MPPARSIVTVEGVERPQTMATPIPELPSPRPRVPRLRLWHAAVSLAVAHPLTGLGPDTFRYWYGQALGLTDWDTRVHANSCAGHAGGCRAPGGGGARLAAGVDRPGAHRRLGQAGRAQAPMLAGVTAAWVAIAGHGLVDTFLTFTPTYVLFALTAALTCVLAVPGPPPEEAHAHRL
ncbi:MAG: hypothetical protein R2712_21355 [Vicinamibacterales bacterium]